MLGASTFCRDIELRVGAHRRAPLRGFAFSAALKLYPRCIADFFLIALVPASPHQSKLVNLDA